MKKPSELFDDKDRARVAGAIIAAEKNTSGEIIPVVAAASGRYDRSEDVFGVLTAVAALSALWLAFQDVRIADGAWKSGYQMTLGLLPVLAIVLAGFAVGAAAAAYCPALKLPFIPKRELGEEVERAAAGAFRRFQVGRTAGGTGILIYVSLFEHRVRVEGGGAIANKLSQEDWGRVCKLVTDGLKAGKPADALCDAIGAAGELLAKHFPIRPDDKNELKNELVLLDDAL